MNRIYNNLSNLEIEITVSDTFARHETMFEIPAVWWRAGWMYLPQTASPQVPSQVVLMMDPNRSGCCASQVFNPGIYRYLLERQPPDIRFCPGGYLLMSWLLNLREQPVVHNSVTLKKTSLSVSFDRQVCLC